MIRLYSQKLPGDSLNLWSVPNLLLQKFPTPEFTVTTKIDFHGKTSNEKSGLIIMGRDSAYVALTQATDSLLLQQVNCPKAENGNNEEIIEQVVINQDSLYLRINVYLNAVCRFSYSCENENFNYIGKSLQAQLGKWMGAKVGLFAVRPCSSQKGGGADFDFFKVE